MSKNLEGDGQDYLSDSTILAFITRDNGIHKNTSVIAEDTLEKQLIPISDYNGMPECIIATPSYSVFFYVTHKKQSIIYYLKGLIQTKNSNLTFKTFSGSPVYKYDLTLNKK
jgi:hypothetical protein